MAGDQGGRRYRSRRHCRRSTSVVVAWAAPCALCATCSLSGCEEATPSAAPPGSTLVASASAPPQPASAQPAAPPTGAPPLTDEAKDSPPGAKRCGTLRCLEFGDAKAAFEHVLASNPRVLAVGEAHAQKGSEGIQSGAARFKEQLLPSLRGKASDLLLELWFPNPKCRKETVSQVEKQQAVVTKKQASTNKNEYVELGNAAKALGITPRSLHPSCDELEAITKAGANDIGLMLETVAKNTQHDVEVLLERQATAKQEKLILAYGGALHNDPYPKPGSETWSFGATLKQKTRYVALDVIVPEYIKDSPAWQAMPWYQNYKDLSSERPDHGALLFEPRPGEFALVFPRGKASSKTSKAPSSPGPDE